MSSRPEYTSPYMEEQVKLLLSAGFVAARAPGMLRASWRTATFLDSFHPQSNLGKAVIALLEMPPEDLPLVLAGFTSVTLLPAPYKSLPEHGWSVEQEAMLKEIVERRLTGALA